MPDFDGLIHGAEPVPEIGIADGKIVSFSAASAREEIDAGGLLALPGKGKFKVGADADLALVEIGEPREVTTESPFYRHRHSPYVGRRLRARVRRTILRGKTIFNDGKIAANGGGGLLKPL